MTKPLTPSERRRTIGAALFSASGSIPLHIAPLLIATLLISKPITHAQAGSIVSCIMAGQIAAAFLAARVKFETLSRPLVTAVFCVYAVAVWYSNQTTSPLLFAGAWTVTGLACGFLMQFGMVTAARSAMKLQAFAWRLSFALFFSGLIAVCLPLAGEAPTHRQLILILLVILLLILVGGLVLWRKGAGSVEAPPMRSKGWLSGTDTFGLGLLLLFFAGLIGFQANAVHFTTGNALDLEDTALAIGLSKGLISLVILWVALRGSNHSGGLQIVYSIALAGAAALIFTQQDFLFLLLAFIAFELFMNLSSAAFMASLSERFTSRAKTFLLIAALLGTLTGPPLAGYLIDTGHTGLPLLLAALSAFLPLLWLISQRHFKAHSHADGVQKTNA